MPKNYQSPLPHTYLLGILSLDFSRLFLCPFQKSPHFFHLFSQKYLTNGSKNVALRALIKKGYPTRHRRLYSFEMEAFLCYPFTHRIHIPIIRTSLFLIFWSITLILFLYPGRPGKSLYSSGIWIFLKLQISLWIPILNFDLCQEILLPCCVLTCSPSS